jgi:tetratricopeptide (TPR) repeat protein
VTDPPLVRRLASWLVPSDSSDRFQFFTLLVWIELFGVIVGVIALLESWRRQWISGLGVLALLPLLVLALALVTRLVWSVITRSAHRFATTVLAGGNLTPAESTSAEEALVARGRIAEAITSFERRIRETPESAPLRFALAALYQQTGDLENAARVLLEIRAMAGADQTETRVSNGLIDLYEKQSDRGRLIGEYARFADRHRGTKAALRAKERLAELKADLHGPPRE